MGEMRLLSLHLRNFKGIQDFILDARGKSLDIYGDNATGKTTLFDAYLWLLFGKDSQGQTAFEIKTLTPDGECLHGLEHEVEGVFFINGQEISLRKVYHEVWTKRRGEAQATFTGHTTDYFFLGVPVSKAEYERRISGIVDEHIFRLLSDPMHFNEQLNWQERRKILLDVCGDISEQEVIATDERLAKLQDVLGRYSIEDYRKKLAADRARINKRLNEIPVRISEVQRILDETEELDEENIRAELAKLRQQQTAEKNDMAEVLHEMNLHIMDLEYQIMRLQDQQKDKARQLSTLTASIDRMEQDLERLAKQYSATAVEKFSFSMDLTCPTCGQPIPEDLQAKMREEAEKEFSQRKTIQLEQINASIEDTRTRLAEVQAIAEDVQRDIQEMASQEALKRAELDALRLEYSNLEKSSPEPLQPDLADKIQHLERQLAKIEQKKAAAARIAELMAEERQLAAEFENIEGELFVTEEFVRAKVKLLEENINSKFEIARFKLFNVLVNSGVEECCETMVNGVPWANLNRGARMNAGLDIIRTLQEHYEFRCPVWIDNAEAVTQLIPMKCQMFRLFVDSRYPKLCVKEIES